YAASLERDAEFAGIVARGASRWQTATILLGEALTIAIVAVLIGTGVGLLASYVGVRVLPAGPSLEGEQLVPFPFVVPLESLLLLALVIATMFVASLFVAWRLARMDVARVLKLRGG
ncbi:MAG: ABC transporter permease, partial [Euryarchaeota archaeon]|nr:ABC transporter permease [Euryarchaeota archaeon]